MATPEEIHTLFAEALAAFEPIVGQPSDADLFRLREAISPILLNIPYDMVNGGADNLVGLIMPTATYVAIYEKEFDRPKPLKSYDDTIDEKATNVTRARAENIHRAKLADYGNYVAAERNTRDFILRAVEDTWVRELRDPDTFYSRVHASALLDHLQTTCGGLHALDILALLNRMQEYHKDEPGIPEYINMLEDAQKTSVRAAKYGTTDAIQDGTLLSIATSAMLSTAQFPRANDAWEDLPRTQQTWPKWKAHYREAAKKAKVKRMAADGADFGRAHQAGQVAPRPAPPTAPDGSPADVPPDEDVTALMEGYFDNLAAAATNDKATLATLVKANAALTATNAELAHNVKELQKTLTALAKKVGAKPPADSSDRRRQPKLCPNCNKVVWHDPKDCYSLESNADKRPEGWRPNK